MSGEGRASDMACRRHSDHSTAPSLGADELLLATRQQKAPCLNTASVLNTFFSAAKNFDGVVCPDRGRESLAKARGRARWATRVVDDGGVTSVRPAVSVALWRHTPH